MKRADWIDSNGYRRAVLLPDDAPDSDAWMGIPIGPLPLTALNLRPEVEKRLHNELYARGVLTAPDIKNRRSEVVAAFQAAFRGEVIALEEAWAAVPDAPPDGLMPVKGRPDWTPEMDQEEAAPERQKPERQRRSS